MDIATLVIAILALLVSALAFWASHRSAKASEQAARASDRSATAAEQSAADGRRSADAAAQSADIAAEQLEMQREASRPRVDLQVRVLGRGTYLLRNEGDAPARGLAVVAGDADAINWDDPIRDVLEPGEGLRFYALSADAPTSLRFTWEGQADPVFVSLP